MKITIKDVAKESGVNISTVSRVINNDSRISQETADKVHQAIEKLGYKPLRKKARQNKTILMAIPNMHIYTLGETISHLSRMLSEYDYDIQLINLKGKREMDKSIAQGLCSGKPGGIILYGCIVPEEAAVVFTKLKIPTVVRHGFCHHLTAVNVNNYNGVQLGIRHLIDQGYKKIGFIGWTPDDFNIRTRYNSFINTLNDSGLDASFYSEGQLTATGGYDATKSLLENNKVDSIFYAADILAYGGIEYLTEQGISYPKDLGIMGFDDAMLSRSLGLTSLDEHIEETARIVIDKLLEMIDGNQWPSPNEINLTPNLIVRRSCIR